MSVTMKEIARRAGVSQPVVSAVLNNAFKNIRVGADTRAKVQKLAKELNYCPNPIARSLKSRRSGMLNIVVPSAYFFSVHHFGRIIAGMQEEADAAEFRLNFTLMPSQRYRPVLAEGLVGDGVLLFYWGGIYDEIARAVADAGYTVLTAYGRCGEPGICNLYMDNRTAVRELTARLLGQGRRRLAFLPSYRGDILHQEGRAGMEEALGGVPDAELREWGIQAAAGRTTSHRDLYAQGRTRTADVLAEGYGADAFIFNHDFAALGGLHLLLDRGVDVPGTAAVAGHNNAEAGELGRPALTSVDLRPHEFGKAVTRRLIGMISGEDVPEQEAFRVEPVYRETT